MKKLEDQLEDAKILTEEDMVDSLKGKTYYNNSYSVGDKILLFKYRKVIVSVEEAKVNGPYPEFRLITSTTTDKELDKINKEFKYYGTDLGGIYHRE